jgi:hypothetical protein
VIASRYNSGMTEEQLAAKAALRKKLAALSFSEKIRILEKLRDREKLIAAAGLRRNGPETASAANGKGTTSVVPPGRKR